MIRSGSSGVGRRATIRDEGKVGLTDRIWSMLSRPLFHLDRDPIDQGAVTACAGACVSSPACGGGRGEAACSVPVARRVARMEAHGAAMRGGVAVRRHRPALNEPATRENRAAPVEGFG